MKAKKLLFPFMMLLMMAVSFSSCCEDDDRYYSPLVGSWELLEDQYGPVPQVYIDRLHFYSNGVGVYEAYDSYGHWSNWDFWWDDYGRYENTVEIRFHDGTTWTYFWELYRGYLYLYDYWDDRNYLIYALQTKNSEFFDANEYNQTSKTWDIKNLDVFVMDKKTLKSFNFK